MILLISWAARLGPPVICGTNSGNMTPTAKAL